MLLTLVFAAFILLLFAGCPIALALGLPSAVALYAGGMPLEMIAAKLVATLDSFTTMAAMFFILAGALMNEYGVSEKLFDFAEKCVGHWRGGLAHANILASVIFAGMSGAALADAAGLGAIEIREMTKRKYSPEISVGITGASSIIGPIIPPSVPMVFYAVVAGSSVGKLFLAGIIPGVICALTLALAVVVMARKEQVEVLHRPSFSEWFRSLFRAVPSMLTIVILLGGIYGGFCTPTEAAVVAVLYTVLLGLFNRKFTWKGFVGLLYESMRTTARVMFIVACAGLFGQVIIRTQLANKLADVLLSAIHSKVAILLLINLMLLILGCFLEQIAAILVVTPIILPIMTALGLSDIQSGLLIVFNLMVGLLTPPFGLVLFTLADVGGLSMKRTIKGVAPFLIPLFFTLLVITFVPAASDVLPNLFYR